MNDSFLWNKNSIQSGILGLFNEQSQKHSNFMKFQQESEQSQGFNIQSLNGFHDRDTINGYSHIFEETIGYNVYQNFQKFGMRQSKQPLGFQPCSFKEQERPQPIIVQSGPQNLKLLSKKVFETLKFKKKLTYNQIMQILLSYFSNSNIQSGKDKNLRRRLYDTVNVLHAANIIEKNRFEFQIVSKSHNQGKQQKQSNNLKDFDEGQYQKMERDYKIIKDNIARKKRQLESSLTKLALVEKLIMRNRETESPFTFKNKFNANIGSFSKLHFPFIFTQFTSQTIAVIQQNRVIMNFGKREIHKSNLNADMDVLGYLFLVDEQELSQIRCKLISKTILDQ